MPSDELNQAIALIQQGQNEQAQSILQTLIQANQQDLAAWSWYVKSCRTPEERLNALQLSLRFNPGNSQILDALQKLQQKLSVQQTPPHPMERAPDSFAPSLADSVYALTEVPETVSEIEVAAEPVRFMGLDQTLGRPLIWYDVWWKALTKPKADTYAMLLQDPLASPGRAYWWIFLAAIITYLVSLANPDLIDLLNSFEKSGENVGTWMAVGMVIFIPVGAGLNILLVMLSAAFYNVLAKVFGGTGNFARTVYLMGAYNAPFSIVIGILSIIPIVNCLTLPLAFYAFRLHVAAIEAAHRLNGGRATLVVLLPTLVIILLFCILGIVLSSMMPELVHTLQNMRR
jgi:hypothetical protein